MAAVENPCTAKKRSGGLERGTHTPILATSGSSPVTHVASIGVKLGEGRFYAVPTIVERGNEGGRLDGGDIRLLLTFSPCKG